MTTVLEVLANIVLALLGAAVGIYTARWTKAFDRWLGTKWKWGGEKHVGTYLIDFLLLALMGIAVLVSNGILQTAALFAFVGLAASVVFKGVEIVISVFLTGAIGGAGGYWGTRLMKSRFEKKTEEPPQSKISDS